MARSPRLYEKLLGWRGGIGSRFSLWLGADHVLLVEANMMTERYQRVWLRDLQGFFVRPCRQARWITIVSLGFILLFGGLAAVASDEEATIILLVFLGLTVPVLLYGLFGARTHYFYAVTAVQRAEWPNIARRRHVRRVLGRLEPLIREAQRAGAGASGDDEAPASSGVSIAP